jgi:hypothetical protein
LSPDEVGSVSFSARLDDLQEDPCYWTGSDNSESAVPVRNARKHRRRALVHAAGLPSRGRKSTAPATGPYGCNQPRVFVGKVSHSQQFKLTKYH